MPSLKRNTSKHLKLSPILPDSAKKWALYLNAGYTFLGEDHADHEFNYSLAAQFLLSDRWALVGEVVGINNFNGRSGDDPFWGLLGVSYFLHEKIVWDIGAQLGMNRAAPDFRLTTGFTFFIKP